MKMSNIKVEFVSYLVCVCGGEHYKLLPVSMATQCVDVKLDSSGHSYMLFLSYQVIEEDGTQANSARVGEVLVKELLKLREEFEVVGDVRGKGLMLGVELVKNKVR